MFFHVYIAIGEMPSLQWLARLREFSVPVMVLVSFFLLTSAIDRRGGCDDVRSFVVRRIKRLWVPMVIWTAVYLTVVIFVLPFVFSLESTGAPSFTVFLTGYRHLWYLEFLFLTSVASLPLVLFLIRRIRDGGSRWNIAAILIAAAAMLAVLFRTISITDLIAPDAEMNLHIFLSQSAANLPFVPLAIAIALVRADIVEWIKDPRSHTKLWMAVAALAIVHSFGSIPFSREIFAVTLFAACLGHFPASVARIFAPLAKNSYAVYILHFIPVHLIWVVCHIYGYNFGPASVLALSLLTFALCNLVASVLRPLPLSDLWLPSVYTSADAVNTQRPEPYEAASDSLQPVRSIKKRRTHSPKNEGLGVNTDVEIIRG